MPAHPLGNVALSMQNTPNVDVIVALDVKDQMEDTEPAASSAVRIGFSSCA